MTAQALKEEKYFIEGENYVEALDDEVSIFDVSYEQKLRVLLEGSAAYGKTCFMKNSTYSH